MDKFALIYEFNKESPLISYMASKEIEAENFTKAIELLQKAIQKFPYHSTPYFLLGKTLAFVERYDEAKIMIEKGDNLLNEKKTFDYYINLIEKIRNEKENSSLNIDETINDVLKDSFVEPEEYSAENDIDLLDDSFESFFESKTVVEKEENTIITETLAEIYASQENYKEALTMFRQLKIIKPDLKEKFENRIEEISTILENKRKFGI